MPPFPNGAVFRRINAPQNAKATGASRKITEDRLFSWSLTTLPAPQSLEQATTFVDLKPFDAASSEACAVSETRLRTLIWKL